MENDEWQERRTESVNEKDTMKNSRKDQRKIQYFRHRSKRKERAAGTGKNSCS